jgi:ATP-binding cassette subfamily B protein
MKILLRILRIASRHKWLLAGAYASTAGATVAYLLLPRLFGEAIDRIAAALEGGVLSDRTMLSLVLVIVAISIVRGIMSFGQAYLGEALGQATVYDLRNQFYDRVQHLSFAFHDRQHTGNLMSRAITDVEAIRMFVNAGIVRSPYFIAIFVGVAFMLIRLDWRLGLVSLSLMPVVAVVTTIVRLHLGRLWTGVQERMAELSTLLQENLTGVRVVKAFASEQYEEAKFDEKNRAVAAEIISAERLHITSSTFMASALLAVMGMVLWYGGLRVIDGHMTPGELAQFLFYMQILSIPVRHAGQTARNFARAISAGERLFEILDAESPVKESPQALDMPRRRGHVRYEKVSFSYDKGVPVLKNVSMDVEPGQVVALLGAPGSGKSTTVHLLPRFYDADSGHVTIDGMDVRDATLKSLRRNIGFVQQDVFLFTASIRDNIAYGRHDATMEEVIDAARVAQMDEFVRGLPEGYETELGERGVTLSGGQRQRLSIARAVLLDPPILILDDSTSSVDASTEERIKKAMESVMRGRTTFVIAHRLSTVHRADQILVLKDGEIVERGTHQELLGVDGLYRQIYELQLRPQEEVMLDFEMPAPATRGASS